MLKIAVLFGGRSPEHDISVLSARSVVQHIDRTRYNVTVIGIDPLGAWHIIDDTEFLKASFRFADQGEGKTCFSAIRDLFVGVDVAFPLFHGRYGEDGSIQGFLDIVDVAYVGPDLLGCALSMDKIITKKLLYQEGIPVVDFIGFSKDQVITYEEVTSLLGSSVVVKPANMGSSLGLSWVTSAEAFSQAIQLAFTYHDRILLEKKLCVREFECAILDGKVSLPGEVIPKNREMYTYAYKYIDPQGASFVLPALLDATITEKIQKMAMQVAEILYCTNMARVDFFLDREDLSLYVNEVNAIPGFTPISLYPRLWEVSGVSYAEMLDRLITNSLAKYANNRRLVERYYRQNGTSSGETGSFQEELSAAESTTGKS